MIVLNFYCYRNKSTIKIARRIAIIAQRWNGRRTPQSSWKIVTTAPSSTTPANTRLRWSIMDFVTVEWNMLLVTADLDQYRQFISVNAWPRCRVIGLICMLYYISL